MPRDEAVETFKKLGEHYKAEIIASIPANEDISLYGQGDWFDLCRGPHVPQHRQARRLQADEGRGRLLARRLEERDAPAHLRHRLGRTRRTLKAYLTRLEEAEKRDHRRIGRELDLFHMQEEAVGSVFWHPKGWTLWRTSSSYMRGRLEARGLRRGQARRS